MASCGYGWVFPKGDHLSAGLLTLRGGPANLNERCDAYLRRLGIAPALRRERYGFLIPVMTRCVPLAEDRILLTGDAAGLADPLTGEGIGAALLSGRMAARSLLAGNLQAEAVCRAYNAEIAATILPEVRVSRRLASLLYNHPRLRTLIFRRYGQELSEAVTDIMTGKRTYRGLFTNPRNYLKIVKCTKKVKDIGD